MKALAPEVVSLLKANGILPVVCLKSEQEMNTLVDAVLASPVRCIEITLRHPYAITAITEIKKNHPELIVGAGTVLTEENLQAAIDAGADYCVSPGYDEELVKKALEKGMFFLPGCITPTEILRAGKLGLSMIKFFPSESLGGVKTMKLYEGALADFTFIPTGGITLNNLPDYLSCKNVIACGGSYMVPKDLMAAGDSAAIAKIMNECTEIRK